MTNRKYGGNEVVPAMTIMRGIIVAAAFERHSPRQAF